jgi:hypothetical protein
MGSLNVRRERNSEARDVCLTGCQQAIRVASDRGTKYDAEFDSVWRNSIGVSFGLSLVSPLESPSLFPSWMPCMHEMMPMLCGTVAMLYLENPLHELPSGE